MLFKKLTAPRTSTLRWSCVLFVASGSSPQGAAAGRGCHSKCQSSHVGDLLSCIGPGFSCVTYCPSLHTNACTVSDKLSHRHTVTSGRRLPVRHRSASQCLHRPLSPRQGLSTYHILSAKPRRTQSWMPRLDPSSDALTSFFFCTVLSDMKTGFAVRV